MKASVKGNNLVLEIPIVKPQDAPLSASGKSRVMFSTHGFDYETLKEIGAGVSINIITRAEPE